VEPGVLLIVVLVVVAIGLGVWAWLHHRYVKSFESRGWTYLGNPPISIAHGLNVAPFGEGFERSVKKQVTGAAPDGTPFSAFHYDSTSYRRAGFVLTMPLPHSMPLAIVPRGQAPVATGDPDYASELASALAPARASDLTVDHNRLVLLGVPDDAAALGTAVEALAAARSALLAGPAAGRRGPTPPPGLSFSSHPDWTYLDRDDSMLDLVDVTRTGSRHEAHDVIVSANANLPFIRLRHTWQTTSTSTDSEGRTHTTTHNHTETVCEFRTGFPFIDLGVNWGLMGRSQRFEWEAFNKAFRIESDSERLAHAVIHQRQMEYLTATRPPKFRIGHSGRIRLAVTSEWLPGDIEGADAFLRGFFSRVPDHVWQELGAWPRPIPELEAGGSTGRAAVLD